jgi:hypothetical protein
MKTERLPRASESLRVLRQARNECPPPRPPFRVPTIYLTKAFLAWCDMKMAFAACSSPDAERPLRPHIEVEVS